MSQVHLTHAERVSALTRWGYLPQEADFLCRAALHGGYFLRRQGERFLAPAASGAARALVERALRLAHVQATTYAGNEVIYHLCARPFYAAIGQEDNRNRRLRQPMTIKNKLMGFDVVLRHPHVRFLATELEKLDHFCGTLGLGRPCLPAKRYAGPGDATERYFVEKFPIFLSDSAAPAAPAVVTFCFVDSGCATVSGFQTFLDHYAPLFEQLREFRLLYVAASDMPFEPAGALWRRFFDARWRTPAAVPDGAELARMQEHFEARLLFEARDWASFDRAKLIRFREGEQRFGGKKYDAFYQEWLAGGCRPEALLSKENGGGPRGQGAFETYRLDEHYDLFG